MHYHSRFTGEYQHLSAAERATVRDRLPPIAAMFPWMTAGAAPERGDAAGLEPNDACESPDLVAYLVRQVDWFGTFSSDSARRAAAQVQVADARRRVVAYAYKDFDGAVIALRCASAALDGNALATCRADVAKIAMVSDVIAFQVRHGCTVPFAGRNVGRVYGVVDAYDDAHAVLRSDHALTLVPLGAYASVTRAAIENAERHRTSIALDLGEAAPRIVREPAAALIMAV